MDYKDYSKEELINLLEERDYKITVLECKIEDLEEGQNDW